MKAISPVQMLRERKSIASQELLAGIDAAKQVALDLPRPLIQAGSVRRVGTRKSGRYIPT